MPIRISRTLYGSRKLEAFLEDLILDFPEARTKAGIDASAIVGRVFNTLITETTKNGRPVSDVSRILQSVPPEIFEKKGIVMLNAPVFFSIYQNVETGKPYQTAAEVVSSGSFLSLSNWQKEAVGESLDFARLAGSENYDLRRDENGAINLEPKTPAAVPAAPAEPAAGDLPWDGNLDGEELPF